MKLYCQTMMTVMDNEDEFETEENQSELEIFPRYINYYLAIMAVSCYKSEYLLYIL